MNRRSWHETTPERSLGEPMSKPNLHALGATPKQRLRSNEDWIKAEEDKKEEQRRKHAEVMRQQFPNPADHWVVEEAERRRMARTKRERTTSKTAESTAADRSGRTALPSIQVCCGSY